MIAGLIINHLKENKDGIVDEINKEINIPLVSEAKEEKVIESLFDGLMEILEGVLAKQK